MYKHAYVSDIHGGFFVWSNMFHVIYKLLVFSFDDRAAVFNTFRDRATHPRIII